MTDQSTDDNTMQFLYIAVVNDEVTSFFSTWMAIEIQSDLVHSNPWSPKFYFPITHGFE